jgi:hypothetical protein
VNRKGQRDLLRDLNEAQSGFLEAEYWHLTLISRAYRTAGEHQRRLALLIEGIPVLHNKLKISDLA